MQALREHLQRMHKKNWIVSGWALEVGDILNIEFEEHFGWILQFPCSPLERGLQTKIEKLHSLGYCSGARCYAEYGPSTIVNFVKDYKIDCHECKGTRFYYPLIGEREPCRTCQK